LKKRNLTPKQRAFADYYIESGNATESAKRAGYSEKTARVIGQENLLKPAINTYIDKQMQKLADKLIMGAQEALELLTSISKS
jgi:phage terminase small subunit